MLNTTSYDFTLNVEPQRLREIFQAAQLAKVKRFNDLKMAAIQQVGHQLMIGLELMQTAHECDNELFARVELPHNVFSWSISDCIKRRKFSLAWHKLIVKQYSRACLRKRKIIADFEELKKYLKLVIDYHSHKNLNFDIVECLRTLQYYITFDKSLKVERDANWNIMVEYLRKRAALQVAEPFSKIRFRMKIDDMKLNYIRNSRLRYARQFYETDVRQAEEERNYKCGKARKDLDSYIKRIENETFCSTCSINYYYSEIQSLKERISKLNAKYDLDMEQITNQVNYSKLTIDKMGAQRIFLTEERQRFKDELAKIREQEAKEAEMERQAAIEHAMKRISKVQKVRKRKPAVEVPETKITKPKVAKVQQEEPESIKGMLKGVMKIKSTKVPKNLNVKNYVKKLNKKYEN